MPLSRNLIYGKHQYRLMAVLLLLVWVVCLAFSMTDDEGLDQDRREVLLRRIGHEILLQSGDSTSRVLPVKKKADHQYQIRFENALTFETDSLVNTTQRLLSVDPHTRDYVVNVLNCSDESVAYAFAISKNRKDDIVACRGRKQPRGCYIIDIKFEPNGFTIAKNQYIWGGLSLLAFFGFVFLKSAKPRSAPAQKQQGETISLGSSLFEVPKRQLIMGKTTIELTGTETRLLLIFALSPNTTIARSRLQKEIWEDEGVVVGRSLDMFISKLRKKLAQDQSLHIAVVRGKGYKLQVDT